MQRISYPDKEIFQNEYSNIFPIKEMENNFKKLCESPNFKKLSPYSVSKILVMSIEELYDLSKKVKISALNETEKDDLEQLFNYDFKSGSYRKDIASFFIKQSELLGIKTCYYCDLELINCFTEISDYIDFDEFINNAPKHDLERVTSVGPKLSEEIINLRKSKKRISETLLNNCIPNKFSKGVKSLVKGVNNLTDMDFQDDIFYFTLDHVFDKAKNPVCALSLYNLVPCCSYCNSKFKTTKHLIRNHNETMLSPSSSNYNFNEDNEFKLFFKSKEKNSYLFESFNDFSVRLIPKGSRPMNEHYEQIFMLNARYTAHKEEVFDLFNKFSKYPDSKIKEISKLLNCKPEDVASDIFGKIVLENDRKKKPKSKLLTDIAQQIGLMETK